MTRTWIRLRNTATIIKHQVTDEVLFKFLKTLGLYEEEKNKKMAATASTTTVDPELLELFEGDAK